MYKSENSALIKANQFPGGYRIVDKATRGYLLIDNNSELERIVKELLTAGAEVFENEEAFNQKYPQLGLNEIKDKGMEFWRNIPEENWPKEVREYFENKK